MIYSWVFVLLVMGIHLLSLDELRATKYRVIQGAPVKIPGILILVSIGASYLIVYVFDVKNDMEFLYIPIGMLVAYLFFLPFFITLG